MIWCQKCAQERQSKWSLDFDACLGCGTTLRTHKAKGFCRACFLTSNESAQSCILCGELTQNRHAGVSVCRVCLKTQLEQVQKACFEGKGLNAIIRQFSLGFRTITHAYRFLRGQDLTPKTRDPRIKEMLQSLKLEAEIVMRRDEPVEQLFLWRRAKKGDQEAWEKLYQLCRQATKHLRWYFFLQRINDRDEIDSTVNEGFYEAIRDWNPLAKRGLRSFMKMVVRRKLIDLVVWSRRQRRTPEKICFSLDQPISRESGETYHERVSLGNCFTEEWINTNECACLLRELLDALHLSELERASLFDIVNLPFTLINAKAAERLQSPKHHKSWDNAIQRIRRRAREWQKQNPERYNALMSAF